MKSCIGAFENTRKWSKPGAFAGKDPPLIPTLYLVKWFVDILAGSGSLDPEQDNPG